MSWLPCSTGVLARYPGGCRVPSWGKSTDNRSGNKSELGGVVGLPWSLHLSISHSQSFTRGSSSTICTSANLHSWAIWNFQFLVFCSLQLHFPIKWLRPTSVFIVIRSVILAPGAVERLVKLGWPGVCEDKVFRFHNSCSHSIERNLN